MSAVRLAIQLPAGAGADVVEAAVTADRLGLDALWVGSIRGESEPSAATTTLLAGIAARTTDIRLVAVLGEGGEFEHVHVAEELGVLDQACGGRVELVMCADTVGDCVDLCASIFAGWSGIELADGRVIRVTPTPQQPMVPTALLAGSDDGSPSPYPVVSRMREPAGRRIEILDPIPPWIEAPTPEVADDVAELARRLAANGVTELVVPITPGTDLEAVLFSVATVVRPALSASSYELDLVVTDALRWHADEVVERLIT